MSSPTNNWGKDEPNIDCFMQTLAIKDRTDTYARQPTYHQGSLFPKYCSLGNWLKVVFYVNKDCDSVYTRGTILRHTGRTSCAFGSSSTSNRCTYRTEEKCSMFVPCISLVCQYLS